VADATTISARRRRLERLIRQGLGPTTAELAAEVGVSRETCRHDLLCMSTDDGGVPLYQDGWQWYVLEWKERRN
jgi:hypothetical protein